MPRQKTNYDNTLIYKLVCKDLNIKDFYVGHTTSFKDRKREHKSRANCKYQRKVYITINDNGGWDNWEMIEIEKFPCKDSNEAKKRERFYYEELSPKLNMRTPHIIDMKEYTHIRNTSEEVRKYKREYMRKRRYVKK